MSDLCFPFNKTEFKKYISMQYFSEYSHHKEILSPFFTQENFQSKNNFFRSSACALFDFYCKENSSQKICARYGKKGRK